MSEPAAACKRSTLAVPASGIATLVDPATPSGAALRTTLACVIAMALAFALHVQVPALAVVFVLARGTAGPFTMLTGAIAGSALALLLLALFDQSRVAFSAALLFTTGLATHAALGRRFAYAYVQGLLSCLVLVGQSLDTPDATELHVFYGLASVAIAALASFITGASQPVRLPAQLQDALAAQLRNCAALLRAPAASAPAAPVLHLALASRRLHALLDACWPTRQADARRRRALAAAVACVEEIVRHAQALDGGRRHACDRDSSEAVTSTAALAAQIERAAPLLVATRGAQPRDWRPQLATAARLADEIAGDPPDARVASRNGESLRADLLAGARGALVRVVCWSPLLRPGKPPVPPPEAPPPLAWGRATERFRIRHALKSAVSYLVVLWAWVAADWGAIVPALVVSVLVATLATPLGATLRKALLRVGGVLLGGVVGLLVAAVLLPYVTTLPAICAIAGLVLLGFLWIQQHRERLVFAALQAAIAFTLTLVHGTGPSPTWRAPLDSLIGLAFGIVVVVIVMHAVWPIDAASSARAVIADLLRAVAARSRALALAGPGPGRPAFSATAASRALAAGFVHEVELYGTQFGRPCGDLPGTLRATLELDALLALARRPPLGGERTGTSSVTPGAPPLDALLGRLSDGCTLVASELSTPGVTPEHVATRERLALLAADARQLARGGTSAGSASPALVETVALAAGLLAEVHACDCAHGRLTAPVPARARSRAARRS